MSRRTYLSVLTLVALGAAALAATPAVDAQAPVAIPVAIPDSPVGAMLRQWLDVYNSADSARTDAFLKAHFPKVDAKSVLEASRSMGGLELVRIISADLSQITYAARSKAKPGGFRGLIEMVGGDPSQIKNLRLSAIPPGAPVEGCRTYAPPSTHGTAPADVASEDAIIAALYESISGPACQRRDWDRYRGLFAPGGRAIPKTTNGDETFGIHAMTPDEYIASVTGSMEGFGFFEKEVSHVGESFNGVVHRFSTYESRRGANDATPFARGINSFQLLNDGKRWWVVNVYWAGERPDAPIPETYLKRP